MFSDDADLSWYETSDCFLGDGSFFELAQYSPSVIAKLALAIVAMPVNGFIVAHYLWNAPPHPKFLLRLRTKISIRLHIISGIVEILTGAAMWFAPTPAFWTRIQAIASVAHAATALDQMPLLFGIKLFMHVGYIVTIVVKFYLAFSVFYHPTCYVRALGLVVVHSIYAWVRIMFVLTEKLGVMKGNQYTISVLFACMIVFPVIHPMINVTIIFAIIVYAVCLRSFTSHEDWITMLQEHSRHMFSMNDDEGVSCPFKQANDEVKNIFRQVDNGSGSARFYDLLALAEKYEKPELIRMLHAVWREKEGQDDATITKKEFKKIMKQEDSNMIPKVPEGEAAADPMVRAECIFNTIDSDRSGTIEVRELVVVLVRYGLSCRHIEQIVDENDKDRNGIIDFEEFYENFKPLWEFAFWELSSIQKPQQDSHKQLKKARKKIIKDISSRIVNVTSPARTPPPSPTLSNEPISEEDETLQTPLLQQFSSWPPRHGRERRQFEI